LDHDNCLDNTGCAPDCRRINNRPCGETTTAQPETTTEERKKSRKPASEKEASEEASSSTTVRTTTVETTTILTTTTRRPRMTAAMIEASKRYTFQGFADATGARELCAGRGRLAMPKTVADHRVLRDAIAAAVVDGRMSSVAPHDTVWLAGRWNPAHLQWEWDDGNFADIIRWAPGQPSGPQWDRQKEPLMAMMVDGLVHDKDYANSFGVMCETQESYDRPAMPEVADDGDGDADAAPDGKGYCCTQAKDSSDKCGTCRVWAQPSDNGFCSHSREHCGNCSPEAAWCNNLDEVLVMKMFAPRSGLLRKAADSPQLLPTAVSLLLVLGAIAGVNLARRHLRRVSQTGSAVLGPYELAEQVADESWLFSRQEDPANLVSS